MFDFSDTRANTLAVISDSGERFTYGELSTLSDELANVMPARSLVFCLCNNTFGALAGYVGCLRNGQVPLLLDANIDGELLNSLVQTYKPKYIYTPLSVAVQNAATVWERFGFVLYKTGYPQYGLHSELALLVSTSGSTGSPKLIRLSYKNLQSNTNSIIQYLEIGKNDRAITTLPMNYVYGLSIINTHLSVGATMLMTDRSVMDNQFWAFFKEENANSFAGVPFTYEILKKMRFFEMELPSLQYLTQAGGKLHPDLHEFVADYAVRTNRRFYVMYGASEATARMGYLPYKMAVEKKGSMGIAIPNGRFELHDTSGLIITQCEVEGELVYFGDNVAMGYAECAEDLAKADDWHGVLSTGDVAMRDSHGYYFITGRLARFIKIAGKRINLEEVERMLKAEFPNINLACSGKDEKLVVFLESSDTTLGTEMRKFAAEKIQVSFAVIATKV
jgi:acyl-coenzyme A synthetase/AMP-(fatty) acid ligase